MATCIFIGAHQDDETLIMGAGVVNHTNAGTHKVYTAAITDGAAASLQSMWTGMGLTKAQWIAFRNTEMNLSVSKMRTYGVINASQGRMGDGTLNPNGYQGNDLRTGRVNMDVVSRVRDVIQQAANNGGVAKKDVRVKTHAWNDPHPDHMAVCQAVLYLKARQTHESSLLP